MVENLSIFAVRVRREAGTDGRRKIVQYMLLIYGTEGSWESYSEQERKAIYQEYYALSNDLREQGKMINGSELQGTSTATTVTVRGGDAIVTDGPFAETKEALGGYYLIEAKSLDEAIEWAARIPSARTGKVEVRPVVTEHAEVS
jgi:hypothetical protein